MADHHENNGPLEVGAAMDYAEHDKTFEGFVNLAKYGTLACVTLMAAMAFGFFVGGFFSGTLLWIILMVAGYFLL
jgi:Bacterial aa3 type cytochrome c oxidase subunit IV